jgi:ADP-heptose:LPS heptosyltransferase
VRAWRAIKARRWPLKLIVRGQMKRATLAFALVLAAVPEVATLADDARPIPAPTTAPPAVLRFDEVAIPSQATVQMVQGNVELYTPQGWVPLSQGAALGDNSRLHIPPSAKLYLAFSPKGSAQFQPAPKERWVALRVNGGNSPASNQRLERP